MLLVKKAQQLLIECAGGIENAAKVLEISKSQVGRWHCMTAPDIMSMHAVISLETRFNVRFVTEAMCRIHGLEIVSAPEPESSIFEAFRRLDKAHSSFTDVMLRVIADGIITIAELREVLDASSGVKTHAGRLEGLAATLGSEGTAVKVLA